MDPGIIIALALSGLVGVALGAFGGGGSLFIVPVLVYVAGLGPAAAVAMSLVIVGSTSSIAGYVQHRQRPLSLRTAAIFGLPSTVAAFIGARLAHLVPGRALMLAFAVLMVLIGTWMLVARQQTRASRAQPRRSARPLATVVAGAAVGVVTGFLGIGGGFLVVPALVAFTGLDMREAVRTSLVVIAINSFGGVLGHVGADPVDLQLAAPLTIAAVAGALIGQRVTRTFSVDALRRGFAVLVVVVGVVVGATTVFG